MQQYTPLMIASEKGNVQLASLLLAAAPDVDAQSKFNVGSTV